MSHLSEGDIVILEKLIDKVLREHTKRSEERCSVCVEGHKEDHQWIKGLREIEKDLKKIRWNFFSRLIQVVSWVLLIWIVTILWDYGIVEWIKKIAGR